VNERQLGVEEAPVSRLDGIDGRIDDIDASTTEQNKRLKNLEERSESGQEDLHRRLITQQGRIDALEAKVSEMKDRLLATAAVAVHINLFKDRIAALEAKCKNI
jgi:predicted  nucleic acid-binding Zn-ribbon protein